jgi:hypothetical protein
MNNQSQRYFTLAMRDSDGIWRAEFGAYDRRDVRSELDDYIDSAGIRRRDLAIVVSAAAQRAINDAIGELNGTASYSPRERLVAEQNGLALSDAAVAVSRGVVS